MQIRSLFNDDSSFLNEKKWDIAFIGSKVDDRSDASIHYIRENVSILVLINYSTETFTISINSSTYQLDQIDSILNSYVNLKILLDATTLGVPEILLLFQSFKNLEVKTYSILYLEPIDYNNKDVFGNPEDEFAVLHRRDFELSEFVRDYIGIPGHARSFSPYTPQKIVFLCGYEADRVDQAFENFDIIAEDCYCVFGVPAFSPGWEMNAFANHIEIVNARGLKDILYCGSTNPLSVYDKLCQIYDSLLDEDVLFIAPLSTKPMSIGACLFLISKPNDRVSLLFDHPQKKKGRAKQVARWNLFEVSIN